MTCCVIGTVDGINKPPELSGGSSRYVSIKSRSLVHNWSITPAEARADNDRSGVYLYHTLYENIPLASDLESNAIITGAKMFG